MINQLIALTLQLLENGVPEKNFADKPVFRFKTIEQQQDEAKASA